ncbi:MAG TPA: HlyD family type I secretion periplasmic adaptor subunit [Magnetospirillaceae bacterium]|nr:HlyD family type I secretion periplasmic adaptor subunit [Magnetospirillaceae bacterium]
MNKQLTVTNKLVAYAQDRANAVSAYFDKADHAIPYSDQMSDPSRPIRIGAVIIFLTFGVFGVWASVAPIDSAAVAPGVVAVESNRRAIQHLEGGIVRDILVEDGATVKAGDVLVRLEDTRARAQLNILQSDLDAGLAQEARLLAERDNLKEVVFPKEVQDHAAETHDDSIMIGQTNLFRARMASIVGQKQILEQRVEQYKEQIVGLRALQKSKEVQLATIQDELHGLSGLMDSGYVTKSRVLALQREEARLQGETGDHIASIARAEQGIGEAKLQGFQLDKQHQEEVAKELREVQNRIVEAREKVVAANDVVRRIDLTAPVNGTVMNLAAHTKGGVVGPGAVIMEIVPDNDTLVLDVQISPLDIDTVHVGDQAAIHISAVDNRLTPVIYGTLDTISADRITDQRNGNAYYKGRVVIAQDQLDRLGEHKLHSGQAVEAMIKRGEQSVLRYLMKPLVDSLTHSFKEK